MILLAQVLLHGHVGVVARFKLLDELAAFLKLLVDVVGEELHGFEWCEL